MILDDNYKMQMLIIEDNNGVPGDIYDNFKKFRSEHPHSNYKFGFCIVNIADGLIPSNCKDYNDSPEKALQDYLNNAYIMSDEYLKNNLYEKTKENEIFLTKELTNNVFSEWNNKLEAFTHICYLYDYRFRFYEDGRIVMENIILNNTTCEWKGKNDSNHLEYSSIDEMLINWLDKIKNDDNMRTLLQKDIQFIEQLEAIV